VHTYLTKIQFATKALRAISNIPSQWLLLYANEWQLDETVLYTHARALQPQTRRHLTVKLLCSDRNEDWKGISIQRMKYQARQLQPFSNYALHFNLAMTQAITKHHSLKQNLNLQSATTLMKLALSLEHVTYLTRWWTVLDWSLNKWARDCTDPLAVEDPDSGRLIFDLCRNNIYLLHIERAARQSWFVIYDANGLPINFYATYRNRRDAIDTSSVIIFIDDNKLLDFGAYNRWGPEPPTLLPSAPLPSCLEESLANCFINLSLLENVPHHSLLFLYSPANMFDSKVHARLFSPSLARRVALSSLVTLLYLIASKSSLAGTDWLEIPLKWALLRLTQLQTDGSTPATCNSKSEVSVPLPDVEWTLFLNISKLPRVGWLRSEPQYDRDITKTKQPPGAIYQLSLETANLDTNCGPAKVLQRPALDCVSF